MSATRSSPPHPSALPCVADATVGPQRSVRLHRYAIGVACCTFLLIMVGSTVTTTGSGLAVPDWPTTYGQNMFTYPPSQWVGGIFFEHGHRLVASTVGMLTIGLCVWLWCSNHSRRLKWLGTSALAAVCLQGLLGGLTVLYYLPTAVSVSHAGLAEIFFCMTIVIAFATSPRRNTKTWSLSSDHTRWLWNASIALLLCVFAQILAGAVMRHTQSGLAITDFPWCYGQWLPPATPQALERINIERVWSEHELPEVTIAQTWIHFGHRVGAVVVTLLAVWLVRRVFRDFGHEGRLVWLSMGLLALLVTQFVLGAMTIWTQRSLPLTTAHVGGGAALLATSLGLVLVAAEGRLQCRTRPDTLFDPASPGPATAPETAGAAG